MGPGAAPATAASYSSTSRARPRAGATVRSIITASRARSSTNPRSVLSGESLLHCCLELLVRRLGELVERRHAVCDPSGRVDHEQVAAVQAATGRAVALSDGLSDVAG